MTRSDLLVGKIVFVSASYEEIREEERAVVFGVYGAKPTHPRWVGRGCAYRLLPCFIVMYMG